MDATAIERTIKQVPGLASTGQQFARTVHEAVLNGGEQTRSLVDLLHGTWLGHPLHAVLTDIPIGAWTLASLCDALAGITGSAEMDAMADTLLKFGVAAAVPTALAGMADYSTIQEDAVAPGALHAILNTTGLGLYLLSIRDRRAGERMRGRWLGALALAIVGASASIGGDLVYRHRVGVNRNEVSGGPREWQPALPLDELGQHEPKRVQIGETAVLLYCEGDTIYAIGAVCGHAGGPLEQGKFDQGCVECPWHQSVFRLQDGTVRHGPATQAQPLYETRVRNGQVEVRIKDQQGSL